MKVAEYMLVGLGSCTMYGILFAIGLFNTDPGSDWHKAWAFFLILTGVCAGECMLILVVELIRQRLGYAPEKII